MSIIPLELKYQWSLVFSILVRVNDWRLVTISKVSETEDKKQSFFTYYLYKRRRPSLHSFILLKGHKGDSLFVNLNISWTDWPSLLAEPSDRLPLLKIKTPHDRSNKKLDGFFKYEKWLIDWWKSGILSPTS